MRTKAFTLIELLIVVLIIAILAAIAVPNFLEFQTRAKVSRAKSDMRAMTVGIEAYYIDWDTYPPSSHDGTAARHALPMPIPPTYHYQHFQITTPIAYLSTLPQDVFNPYMAELNGANYYNFYSGNVEESAANLKTFWMLISYGPDQINNAGKFLSGAYGGWVDTGWAMDMNRVNPDTSSTLPYDPTNGTGSQGDVYRFPPGIDSDVRPSSESAKGLLRYEAAYNN